MSETQPDPIIEPSPITGLDSRWMYNYVTRMMKLGAGDEQVLAYLIQQGLNPQAAQDMMGDIRKAQNPKQRVSAMQIFDRAVKPAMKASSKPAIKRVVKPADKVSTKPAAKPALTQTDYLIDMVLGGAVCLLGFIIVVASITTSRNAAAYFLACGAMTFGALRFYRGFVQFKKKQG